MPLRLALRHGEKIIVNGAVLSAAGRCEIVVENSATILRGREVMSPHEADTPARRLYFACMLAYIDGAGAAKHGEDIVALLGELIDAFASSEAKTLCVRFAQKVASGDYYKALVDCRKLIDYEGQALGRVERAAA
jgi:flagellar biosynthesis repressor protein FlbT